MLYQLHCKTKAIVGRLAHQAPQPLLEYIVATIGAEDSMGILLHLNISGT
jgi:hypothetical protein